MSKSVRDELLEEFTLGFAFDESLRQQLNYEQMIALADMFIGWALGKSNESEFRVRSRRARRPAIAW